MVELTDDNDRLRDRCENLQKELNILKAIVNSGNFIAPDGAMYKVNASQLITDIPSRLK